MPFSARMAALSSLSRWLRAAMAAASFVAGHGLLHCDQRLGGDALLGEHGLVLGADVPLRFSACRSKVFHTIS